MKTYKANAGGWSVAEETVSERAIPLANSSKMPVSGAQIVLLQQTMPTEQSRRRITGFSEGTPGIRGENRNVL